MKRLKFTLPGLIILIALTFSTVSFGKPEYVKKEKKGCVYCHTSATSKELNGAGKFYQEHKSLEGYKPAK